MPHLMNPVFDILPSNLVDSWVAEFFIRSSSTKKEYIVYIIQEYYEKCIQIDIYTPNGNHMYSK